MRELKNLKEKKMKPLFYIRRLGKIHYLRILCKFIDVLMTSLTMAAAAAAAKSLQSCPTLCDPIDRSPPGFPVPGILQARTLEWDAMETEPYAKQNKLFSMDNQTCPVIKVSLAIT